MSRRYPKISRPSRRLTVLLSLAACTAVLLPAQSAFAQSATDPITVLVDQGKYWQAHQRGDLAQQAWGKVLQIDPKQPDALFGMGMALLDSNDRDGAQQYLSRLRAAAPDYPRLDELSRRLGQTSPRDLVVNDARHLAQSGNAASAVQAYQQALADKPNDPQVALEYYQALAVTPQGWDQARAGLEKLAAAHPDDARFALALAQHLTYRDTTRRDGIARLEKLAKDSSVAEAAHKSWRQALLWLYARESDAPLFDAYLAQFPDDTVVKARYDAMVQQDKEARANAQSDTGSARGKTVGEGYAALDRNDIETAKARFNAVLASDPNDVDAIGGLGIAALKQEHFAEARNYLERASRMGNPARWKDALQSATYWTYTSEAIGARSNGQFDKAKALFERAIELNPADVTAQTLLGEMLLANGDARGAEQAYRMALRRQADNPDAIRGLVGALAAQGRGDEALAFANQLNSEQQAKAGGISRLRGEAQAAEARAAAAHGDLGAARSLFEDALLNLPDDPWLRLDLARIYVMQGAMADARGIMNDLLASHPDMVDALYASALLDAETQDWTAGLAQLEKIPAAQRTEAMTVLQHRLWVNQQVVLAEDAARTGQRQQAYGLLQAAQPVAAGDPGLVGALAAGYQQIGDTRTALAMMRNALGSAPDDTDLQLQYASILSAAQLQAELGDVMRRLAAKPLTPQQRINFDNLNIGIVVRQTDLVRQRGDLASAYDVLAPWLAAMPDNPDLQAALGRLYLSAGDTANALVSFRTALSRRPDDTGLQVATLGAATQCQDFKYAATLAAQALRTAPRDPGVLAAVGRMYRAQGNLTLASFYLQRSLLASNAPALLDAQPAGADVPRGWGVPTAHVGATPLPGVNPFVGKTAVDVGANSPGGAAGLASGTSGASSGVSSGVSSIGSALGSAAANLFNSH